MDITTIQNTNTVTIVIAAEQAGDFMNLLYRIADGMDKLVNAAPPPKPAEPPEPPQETYGIRPDAMYPQWQVMKIFSCCKKTLRDWRQKHGLKAYQRNPGTKGSRIWYCGQDLIDFFREFAVTLNIKYPKSIDKEVPEGQLCNPPKDLKLENARTRFERQRRADCAQQPDG